MHLLNLICPLFGSQELLRYCGCNAQTPEFYLQSKRKSGTRPVCTVSMLKCLSVFIIHRVSGTALFELEVTLVLALVVR